MKIEDFENLWMRIFQGNDSPDTAELHLDEMRAMVESLIRAKVLFVFDRVESKYLVKKLFERTLIRWIMDAYEDEELPGAIKFISEELKLLPEHFSELICQTLWRIILDKHNKKEPFGLNSLMNTPGFFDAGDIADFYFGDEDKEPRYVFTNYAILVDYAEKIIQLNNELKEELENKVAEPAVSHEEIGKHYEEMKDEGRETENGTQVSQIEADKNKEK